VDPRPEEQLRLAENMLAPASVSPGFAQGTRLDRGEPNSRRNGRAAGLSATGTIIGACSKVCWVLVALLAGWTYMG